MVGQRFERMAVEPEFMVGAQHAGRRDDQVRLHAKLARTKQQPGAVDRAGGAGHADDETLGHRGMARARFPGAAPERGCGRVTQALSSVCNSPASYISIMMSEPPTNSPLT